MRCNDDDSKPFKGALLISHKLDVVELHAATWWHVDSLTRLPRRLHLTGPAGSRLTVLPNSIGTPRQIADDLMERLTESDFFRDSRLASSGEIRRCVGGQLVHGVDLVLTRPSIRFEILDLGIDHDPYYVTGSGHPENERVWNELDDLYSTFRLTVDSESDL